MKSKKVKNKIIIILSFLLVCISLFILLYRFYREYSLNKSNEIHIEYFFKDDTDNQNEEQKEDTITKGSSFSFDYIAVLEIPKINLKRGLVSQDSKYNNVEYNIQIINGSSIPTIEKSNLILAGHNGIGYKAVFKSLDKLKTNDKIYVYYNGYKYQYTLNKVYETKKDGNIEIYRDNNKNTITLITCKRNSNDIQIVYIGYLENKTTY